MDSSPERSPSILIVDDNPSNLRLLTRMLGTNGYQVRGVTSGTQALASVEASPPDLILLDIMMPKMNGYQVCQRIKQDESTCDIPIVFVSALNATKDKVDGFAAGCVDYVTKPFQVDEVLARVRTHLAMRDLQRQLRQANVELKQRVQELQEALDEVQALSGLLPICAHCKKIRDDQGYWRLVEEYIEEHSHAQFSHAICPECKRKLYPPQEHPYLYRDGDAPLESQGEPDETDSPS